MKPRVKRRNIYWVDCYTSGGWNYASHSNCTWQDVLDLKRVAKLLGETIKYEKLYTRRDEY